MGYTWPLASVCTGKPVIGYVVGCTIKEFFPFFLECHVLLTVLRLLVIVYAKTGIC